MTTHYSIRIVGLHYAANPTYRKEMGTVPEMEKHTVDVLRELDRKRPKVMLMPERDNQWDPHAVMARAKGERIGYVERADQEIMHKLLKGSSKHFLIATIDSIEVEERGNLHVILQAEEEAEKAKIALDQIDKLKGLEVHSSVILSRVDEQTFKKLGVNLTCEPKYQTKKLYHA